MLGSQPILEKTGFGNLRLGPPNKGVGVGHRSICEIMRLTEVETGRNLFRAFLRQPGKHSAQLCPAARGDTGPTGAPSEVETLGSEKKARCGQYNTAPRQGLMPWLATRHTGPGFVWEAPGHSSEEGSLKEMPGPEYTEEAPMAPPPQHPAS